MGNVCAVDEDVKKPPKALVYMLYSNSIFCAL